MLALRTVTNFLKFKTDQSAPLFVSFSVTGRCNLRCLYCDWWKKSVPELSTAKALKVIDNVCSLGVPFFDFSGGEPMMRRDLAILAKRASSHNCLVSMNTNGTLCKTADLIKIAGAFDVVTVSIDGPREVHNHIRGKAGTYEKAVRTAKILKAHGVKVGVNSVVSTWNINFLPSFMEELRSFVDFVQVQPIHPYPLPFQNKPMPEEVVRLQEYLMKLKREDPSFLAVPADFIRGFRLFFDGKAPKICHAGRLYVAIDPSGKLLACAARGDVVIGNVLERSANDLLMTKNKGAWLFKVDSCRGCWLECTVGVSMSVEKSLKEARNTADYVVRFCLKDKHAFKEEKCFLRKESLRCLIG